MSRADQRVLYWYKGLKGSRPAVCFIESIECQFNNLVNSGLVERVSTKLPFRKVPLTYPLPAVYAVYESVSVHSGCQTLVVIRITWTEVPGWLSLSLAQLMIPAS